MVRIVQGLIITMLNIIWTNSLGLFISFLLVPAFVFFPTTDAFDNHLQHIYCQFIGLMQLYFNVCHIIHQGIFWILGRFYANRKSKMYYKCIGKDLKMNIANLNQINEFQRIKANKIFIPYTGRVYICAECWEILYSNISRDSRRRL